MGIFFVVEAHPENNPRIKALRINKTIVFKIGCMFFLFDKVDDNTTLKVFVDNKRWFINRYLTRNFIFLPTASLPPFSIMVMRTQISTITMPKQ